MDIQNDSLLVFNILTEQYSLWYHPPTSQCFCTDMVYRYLQFLNHVRRVRRYQREVIRIRISKKNRQHNGKQKKYKRTKHAYKTKDRETRTPLKIGGELMCSGRVSSSCSTSDTRRVNLATNPVISHE